MCVYLRTRHGRVEFLNLKNIFYLKITCFTQNQHADQD